MSERLDYLKSRFRKGFVYLIYNGTFVKLASQDEMLDMTDGPIFYVHPDTQLGYFESHVGGEGGYTPQRLQALAGLTYWQPNGWVERGILQSSETRGNTKMFGECEAFIAYVLGDFRKRGASMDVMQKVAQFLSRNPEPERVGG